MLLFLRISPDFFFSFAFLCVLCVSLHLLAFVCCFFDSSICLWFCVFLCDLLCFFVFFCVSLCFVVYLCVSPYFLVFLCVSACFIVFFLFHCVSFYFSEFLRSSYLCVFVGLCSCFSVCFEYFSVFFCVSLCFLVFTVFVFPCVS